MPRGVPHSPEVKAAVLAALLTGQAIDAVASEYKINENTVKRWKRESAAGLNDVRRAATADGDDPDTSVGAKLLGYLGEALTTLQAQVIFFRDTAWLRKQSASELAVLHGVVTDKAIRLIEAMDRAEQTEPDATKN